jgi:23S rRNA pseudouridine1911/1915/1917 synthase
VTDKPNPVELVVAEASDGARLDRFLADALPDSSRSLIQKHIEAGAVTIDGAPPKRGAKTPVRAGSAIRYSPPPPEPTELVAEDIPIRVLWQDQRLLVIDKPAGLVVHPALGHRRGTLVNALLHHVKDLRGIGGELRPGIVHRLDRDTTGVMVVAKDDIAQRALVDAFKSRKVEKRYLAVAYGVPAPRSATIDTMYGRHPSDRKRFSSKVAEGKRAITLYEVREVFLGASLLDLRIDTGRTHQIRVHLADRGHPLVGDRVYGGRARAVRDPRVKDLLLSFPRPALHARRLAFPHPDTGETLSFEAPIPEDLLALIEALRVHS